MKHSFWAGTTAAIALFTATGAFADVTPEDVWSNWKDMATTSGATVTTSSEVRDGATLKVSGATFTKDGDKGGFSSSIDEISLTDNGDGTVKITMSEKMPFLVKSPTPATGAKPADMTAAVTTSGMSITASGTADAMKYDFTAATMDVKLGAINGTDAAANNLEADIAFSNISGNELIEGEAGHKTIATNFTADSMKIAVSAKDPGAKSDVVMNADMQGISGQSSSTMVDMTDMAQALAAGFAMNTTFGYASTKFDVNADKDGKTTQITGTGGAGDLTMAMDKSHLKYAVNAKDAALSISGSEIPFPQVDVSYQEAAINIDMPTSKTDAPTDFAFLTKLVGFNVSEPVWAMVDPTGALPHDGVTLILDAKGKATVKSDLFANAETATPPSGELNALDLSEIKLSAAGAELTGNGALTFDNTDMVTFGGMPTPTGKVELKLTGANGLLDKIVAMGLLKAEDVMGYRMMASMFTVATPDKDELTSVLEFKDKGFYANNQRLK